MARARPTRRHPPRHSRPAWRWWTPLVFIVLASIAVRAAYVTQLGATPLTQLHRWDQTDMIYYERWARAIADGDWLSRSIAAPMHGWHRELAEEYLGHHPDERAALEQEAAHAQPAADAATLLWSRWLGPHRFYQDPLYPYLIGLTYKLFGQDVRYVFAWQLVAGALTNVLIFLLARRFFGRTVAAVSGLMAVLAPALVYYDLILLRESSIIFTGLWLVWLTDRAWTTERARPAWFAALGFSAGTACLLKSTFALFVLMIAAATIWRFFRGRSGSEPDRARSAIGVPAAAAIVGFALALAPLAARNLAVGAPPLDLASAGPMTFIASNIVDYPVETGFAIDTPRVARVMGDTYGRPVAAVLQTLQSHTLGSFATMLWKKWEYAWLWYEIPNNEDFYYMRLQAPVLGILPATFWLVGSLGLIGLVLSFLGVRGSDAGDRGSTFDRPWVLYALVGTSFAQLIVFYVIGRFRAPLVAALVPFAALTLVQLGRWGSAWNYRPLALTAAGVAGLLAWSGRASPVKTPLIRPADWLSPFVVKYQAEVQRAVAEGHPGQAAAAFLEFFRYEPDLGQIMATGSPELAVNLGHMHKDCADLLRQSGQPELARAQDEQAARLLRMVGG